MRSAAVNQLWHEKLAPCASCTSSSGATVPPTWLLVSTPATAKCSTTILHGDPYRLTEVEGVGFARADKIALAADVPPESDKRAQAAAVYVLREAEQGGNSFLPMEELTTRTAT